MSVVAVFSDFFTLFSNHIMQILTNCLPSLCVGYTRIVHTLTRLSGLCE